MAKIVIVGAGCFGVSTAYHLLKRGFTEVTILDRSAVLPAPDAASNDMNRVVRSSYSDIFYTKLAREAMIAWKNRSEWRDTYRESGVLVLGFSENEAYANQAYQNDLVLGATLTQVADTEAIRSTFPSKVPTATFDNISGYLNKEGGWADAGQGVTILIDKVISLGGKILPGKPVKRITRSNDGKANGVECEDGTSYEADTVIIATGSWTPSTFPDLAADYTSGLSTGNIPVIINFQTGFYIFPPTNKGIVKMGMHLAGYTHLHKADIVDGTIDPDVAIKFSVERSYVGTDGSRPGMAVTELDLAQLCMPEDLQKTI
ncbi:hypothetical protein C0992_003519 [Termitomyces sp. T32_za158]|nr:hypothetical protein C0992_003519 [Termitomyces sp. T32_za158]